MAFEDTPEFKRAMLEDLIFREIEKDPEFVHVVLSIALQGLKEYKQNVTRKNSDIDLIVRNLKPEHYAEIQKYVVDEVFERLGLQEAIKVIHEE